MPSVFKSLAIPYKKISKKKIDKLNLLFMKKASIDDICDYVDSIVLNDIFSKEKIDSLKSIRCTLQKRRLL